MQEPLLDTSTDDGDGYWEFDKVLRQERHCIERKRQDKLLKDTSGKSEPFSLAFSGGGIRAAAFQAGVLWRLAEMNRLKDVDYFTAVSGGGYITSAFASFCMKEGEPEQGKVKEWYQKVVAKTITRMQNNAGDFVRDTVANPGYGEEGAGALPRCFDLPILLVTLVFSLLVNPVVFMIIFVVPLVMAVAAFYGAAMRASFCVPPDSIHSWWNIFWLFSPLNELLTILAISACLTFVGSIVMKFPGLKPPPEWTDKEKARPVVSKGYVYCHAIYGVLKRFTIFIAVFAVFLTLVTYLQTTSYGKVDRLQLCQSYMDEVAGDAGFDCSNAYNQNNLESVRKVHYNLVKGDAWYQSPMFDNYSQSVQAAIEEDKKIKEEQRAEEETKKREPQPRGWIKSLVDWAGATVKDIVKQEPLKLFFCVWLFCVVIAIFISPLLGTGVFTNIMCISGPAIVVMMLTATTQYVVFGAITKNKHGAWGAYSSETVHMLFDWSLLLWIPVVLFYEELRSALHVYYKRCLQTNYFHGGADVPFRSLADKQPFCPFVILTGTSSDFQPPGDHDVISELSFSALHTGSEETGYVDTPEYQSLSKATALTGAGCFDAISLSMNESVWMRFWLQVLNLTWGDYILFQPKNVMEWCGFTTLFEGSRWYGQVVRFVYRIPAALVWFWAWWILSYGWQRAKTIEHAGECISYRDGLQLAGILVVTLIGLSFLSCFKWLNWLAMAPLLRQIHQATRFFYVGRRPPQMLYVTDGGVKDCTALVQLMRRKCKRILLVLAAADPRDELGVLQTAMKEAKELKIGCFYDPTDPRRDLSRLFKEYKEDRSKPYLHIGISYCWPGENETETTGHLYIVKNRLPPEFENCPVEALLTPQEVMGQAERGQVDESLRDLKTDQLGPFGCCDCCHTNGLNCGAKFPHGTFTGYMYLTPQWSNSLTRLAYNVSKEAINAVTGAKVTSDWEGKIR